jgi:hypothetical protein
MYLNPPNEKPVRLNGLKPNKITRSRNGPYISKYPLISKHDGTGKCYDRPSLSHEKRNSRCNFEKQINKA